MGFDKGSAILKFKPKDFIVQEIDLQSRMCEVSNDIGAFQESKVDLHDLDVNSGRDFLYIEVEKIDTDHFSLLKVLSEKLDKRFHEIGYAGTKDKNAWTIQKMSFFHPILEKLNSFHHPKIILKNPAWGKHKIKIGNLKGNRFRVTLRDVDESALKVLNRLRNTTSLPNLFGSQRFGSLRKDNFNIGKLILKKKYKEAIFVYLVGCGQDEPEEVQAAKKKLKEEKNIAAAKLYFPQTLKTEHQIIEHLSKNQADYLGALKIIGEKTLLIMVQSVQSKIFNEVLENAIETKSIKEGDSLSIIGYNHTFTQGKIGRIEKEVLEDNDLSLGDFAQKDIPELSLISSKRKAFFEVKEMNIETAEDEEFSHSKKIILNFTLDPESYATTLLEYFFDLR